MARRRSIVAVETVLLAALLAVLGRTAWVRFNPCAEDGDPAHFLAEMARVQPRLAPLFARDPDTAALARIKARNAARRGGLDAGRDTLWHVAGARYGTHAGDDTVIACDDAWSAIYRAVDDRPALCKLVFSGASTGYPADVAPLVAAELDACTAVLRDGFEHRNRTPGVMPTDEVYAIDARLEEGVASDPHVCGVPPIVQQRKRALDRPVRARLIRTQYAGENWEDGAARPLPMPPLDGFRCAPIGTVFVLSNFLNDGVPNTWTSLGPRPFDCAVRNRYGRVHGIFSNLEPDRYEAPSENALRALWPFAVGKRGRYEYDPPGLPDEIDLYTVRGFHKYWVAGRKVAAFAIETDTRDGDGHYVVTNYWAPSLGADIGRDMRLISGHFPANFGVPFQVVAILPPPRF